MSNGCAKQDIPEDVNLAFPFWVVENNDGSLTFHWDENHPVTSVFNEWTEKQFVDMLTTRCNEIIEGLSNVDG